LVLVFTRHHHGQVVHQSRACGNRAHVFVWECTVATHAAQFDFHQVASGQVGQQLGRGLLAVRQLGQAVPLLAQTHQPVMARQRGF
jgi:hypothetical protein